MALSCRPAGDFAAGLGLDARTRAYEKSSLGAAVGRELRSRIGAMVNVAGELRMPGAFVPKGVLEGSEAVGYKVVRSADGARMETRVLWSESAANEFVRKSKAGNFACAVTPVYHCRPWLNKDSPLPAAAARWNDAELGEWLAWEWAARRLGTRDPQRLSAVSFAAWRIDEALLARMQGPGSLQLARWREAVRDRRTFQILICDLQGQVKGILASHAEPKDRDSTLRRIERNWFFSYQQQYPNRFLSNGYRDFGKDSWVDPLVLEGIETDTLGWKRFESSAPQGMDQVPALLEALR
jgi:hypothetical protein